MHTLTRRLTENSLLLTWVVVNINDILIYLRVPAVQKVRSAAARTQSTNNARQLGIGVHAYHDVQKRLPFNGLQHAVGPHPYTGSWGWMILPYIEQEPLYKNVGLAAST